MMIINHINNSVGSSRGTESGSAELDLTNDFTGRESFNMASAQRLQSAGARADWTMEVEITCWGCQQSSAIPTK
jgi:hypothetical protein